MEKRSDYRVGDKKEMMKLLTHFVTFSSLSRVGGGQCALLNSA